MAEGLLHAGTPDCFTAEAGNRLAPRSTPTGTSPKPSAPSYRPETIVATGTGSGKSFCFGIPIVSECLRMRDQGVRGIKAVIVYPMNALANSQYDDFARRLAGSGLKLARYTGDTFTNPDGRWRPSARSPAASSPTTAKSSAAKRSAPRRPTS